MSPTTCLAKRGLAGPDRGLAGPDREEWFRQGYVVCSEGSSSPVGVDCSNIMGGAIMGCDSEW